MAPLQEVVTSREPPPGIGTGAARGNHGRPCRRDDYSALTPPRPPPRRRAAESLFREPHRHLPPMSVVRRTRSSSQWAPHRSTSTVWSGAISPRSRPLTEGLPLPVVGELHPRRGSSLEGGVRDGNQPSPCPEERCRQSGGVTGPGSGLAGQARREGSRHGAARHPVDRARRLAPRRGDRWPSLLPGPAAAPLTREALPSPGSTSLGPVPELVRRLPGTPEGPPQRRTVLLILRRDRVMAGRRTGKVSQWAHSRRLRP